MKVYLAGPITGVENWRQPFVQWAAALRAMGYEVFSPEELQGNEDHIQSGDKSADLRRVLSAEFGWLVSEADAIALIPGWETSRGSNAEWAIARTLGLEFMYL